MQPIDTAMIFAAGMGTRFKPWTDHHPKALAPVNGKSLLQRNVEYLAGFGIKNVIINVHHFAEQIIEEVEKQKGWGSRITISDEREQLLETGGGLMKAKELLEPAARFVTINADILTNLDLTRLVYFHEKESALISFGVTTRPSARELLFDADQQLKGWKNKTRGEIRMVKGVPIEKADSLKAMAYSCVTVMERSVFSLITQKGKFSLIDTYLDLASSQRIKGFEHSGDKLVDVGKTESITLAEKLFL